MQIFVVSRHYNRRAITSKPAIILTWDNWNDFSFLTLFGIDYIDEKGDVTDLGSIKIGFFGQKESERGELEQGMILDELPSDHFSIGLDDEYYLSLNKLGTDTRDDILNRLHDVARYPKILRKALKENVFKVSFLRGLSLKTIEGKYARLAVGGIGLTPYHFQYISPGVGGSTPMTLKFKVSPSSNPPTNIHIIVGRNGVGKTFLIDNMIECLTRPRSQQFGKFLSLQDADENANNIFSNLICITFSAFDEFEHPPEKVDKSKGIQYYYIGLKTVQTDGRASEVIEPDSLYDQFSDSINAVKRTSKEERWNDAIRMLESDPMFKAANILELIKYKNDSELATKLNTVFKKLSSGHKLILLTITRLVEKLEERSLVLIDEPETHLHPPLLSAFMRALANLLISRNAVSIIATHSPVVLQEVPKKCIYKLTRSGKEAIATRPRIETFGENVGILTQEIFGLEVTESGFQKILKELVKKYETFDDAFDSVGEQLGLEAQAILRGLFHQKRNSNATNS